MKELRKLKEPILILFFIGFGLMEIQAQESRIATIEKIDHKIETLALNTSTHYLKDKNGNKIRDYGITKDYNYFSFDLKKNLFKRNESHKVNVTTNSWTQEIKAVHKFEIDNGSMFFEPANNIYVFNSYCITENNIYYSIAINVSSSNKKVVLVTKNGDDNEFWEFYDN